MNNYISFDDALEKIKAQGEQERRTIEIAEAIANNDAADAIEKLLAENERLKKKLDAAVRDIELMLESQELCFICGNYVKCRNQTTDGRAHCDPKWRGED